MLRETWLDRMIWRFMEAQVYLLVLTLIVLEVWLACRFVGWLAR